MTLSERRHRRDCPKLAALFRSVRAELEPIGHADTCLLAAAVLTEALRRTGVDAAYPLAVQVRVWNAALADEIRRQGIALPDALRLNGPAIAELAGRAQQAGAPVEKLALVTIGCGVAPGPDHWAGHVVVMVPVGDQPVLCDLTITQASRPGWRISLAPLLETVPAEFVEGVQPVQFSVQGAVVNYSAFPADRSFEDTPIWRDTSSRNAIVGRVLHAAGPVLG